MNYFTIVACGLVVGAGPQAYAGRIEIKPIPEEVRQDLPRLNWVLPGTGSWELDSPLFELKEEGIDTSSTAWAAVTETSILIKIVVSDDLHINKRTDGDIWNGDSIQIGIDARGDATGLLPKEYELLGPDDASITFALTEQGPRAWAHYHGRPGGAGATPRLAPVVTRDEQSRTTTYQINLPWQEFQSRPGVFPTIGLAIQINDTDLDDSKDGQHRLYWGKGAGGRVRPGSFNQVAIARSPKEFFAVTPTRSSLWRGTDAGEFVCAIDSKEPILIEAKLGEQRQELTVPGFDNAIQRYLVRGFPEELPELGAVLEVKMKRKGGETVLSEKVNLDVPGQFRKKLSGRIDAILRHATEPVLIRHLRSTVALVEANWISASTQLESHDQPALDTISYVRTILTGLDAEAGQWQPYLSRRRRLILSFVSETDRTLQFFQLLLPRDWDAKQSYPLIVSLHGSGNPHPLNFVGNSFGPVGVELCPGSPEAYVLSPWGRGNLGYEGVGENDVWEAISNMKRSFKVNEDRQYLTGFSMGGGGTWSLGLRTPEKWAALAICSGGAWRCPVGLGLGENLKGIPVRIWHGDKDMAAPVSGAFAMREELQKFDVDTTFEIIPGLGHVYEPDSEMKTHQWLLQYTRKPAHSFSFVCDTSAHRGRNGIVLKRDPVLSFLPRFDCRIEGECVYISSEGTPELEVELGAEGLGLTGKVVLFWNDHKVFEGPPRKVKLTKEPALAGT